MLDFTKYFKGKSILRKSVFFYFLGLIFLSGCSGSSSNSNKSNTTIPVVNTSDIENTDNDINVSTPVDTNTSFLENNISVEEKDTNTTTVENNVTSLNYLSQNNNANFKIDPETGMVIFQVVLDAQTKNSYDFSTNIGDENKSNVQNISITVSDTKQNQAPVIISDFASIVPENTIQAYVIRATDYEEDTLVYSISGVDREYFTLDSSNGIISFKEAPDYEKSDLFIITVGVSDGINNVEQSVIIKVNNVNEAPITTSEFISMEEDSQYNGLLYARDADNDVLTFIKHNEPSHGILTLKSNGLFSYTPNRNYYGSDSFSYKVNDGTLESEESVVNISITNINDLPSIDTVFENIVLDNINTQNFELNISDFDGDGLTLKVESNDTSVIVLEESFSEYLTLGDYENKTLDFNISKSNNNMQTVRISLNLSDGETNTSKSFDISFSGELRPFESGDSWKGFVYKTVKSPYTGRIWLDRNLGASRVCTAYDDGQCYGNYYQWGRPADGHQLSNTLATSTQATDINNTGHSKFIYDSDNAEDDGAFYDWVLGDDNGSKRQLNWSNTDGSSICPVGYRVPNKYELEGEIFSIPDEPENNADMYEHFLKVPSSGYRSYTSGALYFQRSHGYLWSTSTHENYAHFIYFRNNRVSSYSGSYAYGRTVRCIKD